MLDELVKAFKSEFRSRQFIFLIIFSLNNFYFIITAVEDAYNNHKTAFH